MMRSLLPQSNSTSPLGWRIRKKPTGIETFPLEPFCRIDLSSVSAPDENTYSFTSFGGSAAYTAVAIIAVAAIEPRNRILARLARIVSSQGCTIMFLITKYILVPVANQIRIYWWCSPPRTGRQRMCPVRSTARETGVSFSKDRCVRTSCTTAVCDGDAAHRTQQHGQGSPVGSNR